MILNKILLGIGLALPIGPVSAEMIKRGLQDGFWAAFNIRVGGAIGNTLCLVCAYFGLSFIVKYELIFSLIGLIGAALLFYMGVTTLLKVSKEISIKSSLSPKKAYFMSNSLILGFILAVANPIGIVFWLGISAAGFEGASDVISIIDFAQNLFIIVGVLLWGATLSLILEFSRRILTDNFIKGITLASGLILVYFGVRYGVNGTLSVISLLQ